MEEPSAGGRQCSAGGGVSDWSLGGAVGTQRRKDGESQSRGQDKRRAGPAGVGVLGGGGDLPGGDDSRRSLLSGVRDFAG